MNDIPEVKSLLWLAEQFPAVEKPQNDIGRMQNCIHRYCMNAVNLINRQKAEIESLKLINSTYEVETKRVRDIAIQEFAEKLKFHKRRMCGNDNGGLYWDQAVLVDDIDRALKAMTEGEDDS